MEAYQHHGYRVSEKCGTLTAGQNESIRGDTPILLLINDQGGGVMMVEDGKVGALNCMHDQQAILCVALDRAAYNQGQNAQFAPGIDDSGKAFTVIAKGPGGSVTVLTTLCSREVQHTKGEDGTKT